MKKILVIEDDYDVRSSVRELLKHNKYKVFSAADGNEGLQLIHELKPDLIICDIKLPGISGFDIKIEINKYPELFVIPFIFLTGRSEASGLRDGMILGAEDYLVKPYNAQELLSIIDIRLRKMNALKEYHSLNDTFQKNELSENSPVLIKTKKKSQLIKTGEIVYITSENVYSIIHLSNSTDIKVRKLIKQWQDILPARYFLRVHRSFIINITYLDKVDRWFNNSYRISLRNTNEHIIVGKKYTSTLKKLMI